SLSMERPLFKPAIKPVITSIELLAGDEDIDPATLFDQVVVDKLRLTRHIRHALQTRAQITLSELLAMQPLEQGLAELVTYLQLGSETFATVVDEDTLEPVRWQTMAEDGTALTRTARLPRLVFTR
ncbi:MAG TPA: DUF3375 family protein, partial [Dokdonella sp.]|uniref:DUF3375 family protein n=1 Tax=Dokdonella sp. TaxID=2291710 RepID=UPI002D804D56